MPYTATQPILPWQAGSETSHEAAVHAKAFAGEQQQRVYRYLQSVDGATQKACSEVLGIGRPSIAARFRELEQLGMISKTLQRRAGCCVYSVRTE